MNEQFYEPQSRMRVLREKKRKNAGNKKKLKATARPTDGCSFRCLLVSAGHCLLATLSPQPWD